METVAKFTLPMTAIGALAVARRRGSISKWFTTFPSCVPIAVRG